MIGISVRSGRYPARALRVERKPHMASGVKWCELLNSSTTLALSYRSHNCVHPWQKYDLLRGSFLEPAPTQRYGMVRL